MSKHKDVPVYHNVFRLKVTNAVFDRLCATLPKRLRPSITAGPLSADERVAVNYLLRRQMWWRCKRKMQTSLCVADAFFAPLAFVTIDRLVREKAPFI